MNNKKPLPRMVKIRCKRCKEIYIYMKKSGGAKRKYHPECARLELLEYQRKYYEKWHKRNREKLKKYNHDYYVEYKNLLLGFEQMRLEI